VIDETYTYQPAQLVELLIARHFPEFTDRETPVIHAFLAHHAGEFSKFQFSVRVGVGVRPDPAHLPGVQAAMVRSTKKRMDLLFWQGEQPWIIEAKERITPAVLGQLRAYRHLLLEERPDLPEPVLATIGRYSDDDTIRVLQAEGVHVYIYTPDDGE
jgi:hypothetical protein